MMDCEFLKINLKFSFITSRGISIMGTKETTPWVKHLQNNFSAWAWFPWSSLKPDMLVYVCNIGTPTVR